jgi:hypothetical protein
VGNSYKLDQLQLEAARIVTGLLYLLGTNHNLKKKQNIEAGLMQY